MAWSAACFMATTASGSLAATTSVARVTTNTSARWRRVINYKFEFVDKMIAEFLRDGERMKNEHHP